MLRAIATPVQLPGSATNEHFDIFLAREIYPVLVPGLEELSREVDRLRTGGADGTVDQAILERFNPAIFLAEYLMRNNPNHGQELEYGKVFVEQARIEKIRRFFKDAKQKLYKHYCI